jgi:Putative inner membrane protein (DUF1819)
MLSEKLHFYGASFTAGALLLYESIVVIPFLLNNDMVGLTQEIEIGEALKINSASSRKRKVGEITKRFKSVKPIVWERFMVSDEQEQVLILYYVCLKTYPILKDFQIDVLLRKWLNYSLSYDKYIFYDFLFRQTENHPEIDEWTDETKNKLSSVINVMLTELGLLKDGELRQLNVRDEKWQLFVTLKEYWFMEALFLSADERESIIQNV